MANLFEMGADFDNGWSSDNKDKTHKADTTVYKEASEHRLHFAKEKRRGKVVTIVKPFYLRKETLEGLVKNLKKKLGTGGTIRENSLEFQGDIPQKIRAHLVTIGYVFK